MNEVELSKPTELEVLQGIADELGIQYRSNTGAVKLQALIDEASAPEPITETTNQRNSRLKKEAHALVRVRVSCMNPNKKQHENGLFSVSNSVIGTVRVLVPFDMEEGWHIPKVIYDHLKACKCQLLSSKKAAGGKIKVVSKLISEFNIEVLDPLTKEELKELATQQALSGSIDK